MAKLLKPIIVLSINSFPAKSLLALVITSNSDVDPEKASNWAYDVELTIAIGRYDVEAEARLRDDGYLDRCASSPMYAAEREQSVCEKAFGAAVRS